MGIAQQLNAPQLNATIKTKCRFFLFESTQISIAFGLCKMRRLNQARPRGSGCPQYAKFGHFTLLFRNERLPQKHSIFCMSTDVYFVGAKHEPHVLVSTAAVLFFQLPDSFLCACQVA